MSRRTAAWLAWSLAALSVVTFLASVALYFLTRSMQVPGSWITVGTIGELLVLVPFLAFPIVGALVASERPHNPIGWICLVAGLLWMVMLLSEAYGEYGLARPGSVPFPVTVHALLYAWLWVPAVGLMGVYLILLFPDGRLPSKRWRPLVWFSGALIVFESAAIFLTPGPLELGGIRNPFGLEGHPWVNTVALVVLPLLALCMVASAVSLVMRYRHSGGEVRQQIKWIAFAGSLVGLLYFGIMSVFSALWLLSGPETLTDLGTRSWWGVLLEHVMVLSFAGVPVAIGFAVLKYRLYDIDRIINRTLVYGLLTVTLALVYVGGVLSLQAAFRVLTGQESTLAVFASTLAIAALFGPLRRRVQALVDRRFYRRKYDAAKTLEAFNARLREETDLNTLSGDVVGVVKDTMQPSHASLWLRSDTASRRQQTP
jgi:hypothetical protein